MAQTPDAYLWLGGEFGLFRFDGVLAIQWQPPAGQQLSDRNINSLFVTRDGTLWIGTFGGLVALSHGRLSRPPGIVEGFVASLFEDSDGMSIPSILSSTTPQAVRIDQLIADHKTYWQNLPGGTAASNLQLPRRIRELAVVRHRDYTGSNVDL
jgi:hypothetical protein